VAIDGSGAPAVNDGLRVELMRMFIEHVSVLRKLMSRNRMPGLDTPAQSDELDRLCQRHGSRLKEIVAEFGWPGVSLVGEDGTRAASYILDHIGDDLPFMERCLDLMEAVLYDSEVDPPSYATLLDSVLVARGQMQIFGTQHARDEATGERRLHPTADIAGVDDRRLAFSLPTLAQDEAQWRRLKKVRDLQKQRTTRRRRERRMGDSAVE
jgi:hypothetical protein